MDKTGRFSDTELGLLERFARLGLQSGRPTDMQRAGQIAFSPWEYWSWAAVDAMKSPATGRPIRPAWMSIQQKPVEVGGKSLGSLLDLAEQMEFRAGGAEAWDTTPSAAARGIPEAEAAAGGQPVTIHIINNTGTVIRYDEYGMRIGDAREPLDIERF